MRPTLLLLLLAYAFQTAPRGEPPVATPEHLRYQRTLTWAQDKPPAQVCAILDAQIFPHAEPALKDLRIFRVETSAAATPHEIPYAITLSESLTEDIEPARVLNLGTGPGPTIVFDLEMPDRPYTDVVLDLSGSNFLATATVTGAHELAAHAKTVALGTYTLFDLSAQHLSRDTTLPLQESTFRYLHVVLAASPTPGTAASEVQPVKVTGAQIPPSRESQTLYTTIGTTSTPTTGANPRETRFTLPLPLRVPVERVSFDIPSTYHGNFSRDIEVDAILEEPVRYGEAATRRLNEPGVETVYGTISRVHSTQGGHRIDLQQLSIPAILGSNLQSPATVSVVIKNGDDQPIPITAVRLEMRQRQICFAPPSLLDDIANLALYYGDPTLQPPIYDYARLFASSATATPATLGPELPNPAYHPPAAEARPFTERHPEVLWIALIAAILALGLVAFRSSRHVSS
jgi:hypothetical protein